MIRRRLTAAAGTGLAIALCAGLATAGGAGAAPVQTFAASVAPNRGGTAAAPRMVALRLTWTTRDDVPGAQAPATYRAELLLPSELALGGSAFPSCLLSVLADLNPATRCAARSRIGAGTATLTYGGQDFPATITAYNGPRGKSVLLDFAGAGLARAVSVPISRAGEAGFGKRLVFNVPVDLREYLGTPLALTSVTLRLKALRATVRRGTTVRRVPYAGLRACTDGQLAFGLRTTLVRASAPTDARVAIPCT